LIDKNLAHYQQSLENGEVNPLDIARYAKYLELMAKGLSAICKEESLNELSRYGGKTQWKGVRFTQYEAGTKWDYSATPKWQELKDKMKEIEAQCKAISAPVHQEFDGVIETLSPAIKSSTTTYKIEL
jgi:hypothetical protein